MNDRLPDGPRDPSLNPALKSQTETAYETKVSTPAPIDTASAKENEGEGWPVIWLVVTVACILLAVYFLL